MNSPFLLCLSGSTELRETRWRVLLTRYHALAVSSVAAMQDLPRDITVDLLVLCHTMSVEECDTAIQFARARWPGVKVLGISKPYSNCTRGKADAVVGGLAGPAAMFDAIAKLLPAPGTAPAWSGGAQS